MDFNDVTAADVRRLGQICPERVSTGESVLDQHAQDESGHPPVRPEVVVWPTAAAEVCEVVGLAAERRIPVTAWGAGSSLEGNPIPVRNGIVVDFSQMDRLVELRPESFQADVEPGLSYKDLNARLRHEGLFFPPDPGAAATLGGMIANNASGVRTVRYRATKDNVLGLQVVLADGSLIHTGTCAHKSSSGYDLTRLLVGSEGTLGLVVGATLKLSALPAEASAAVVSFGTIQQVAAAVFQIMRGGLAPAAMELLDQATMGVVVPDAGLDLAVRPTAFLEFHSGSAAAVDESVAVAREICEAEGAVAFCSGLGAEARNRIWEARYAAYEALRREHPGWRPLILDTAVPLGAYTELVAFAAERMARTDLPGYLFGHAGDGNLHIVCFTPPGDDRAWQQIQDANADLVRRAIDLHGTATGEHGVGLGKRRFMDHEHGSSLAWMRRIKQAFDPLGILNPDKIL